MAPIRVRVLLFAAYRELVGTKSVDVEVEPGATVSDVFDQLERAVPELGRLRPYTSFAVNRAIEPPGHPVSAGDEIAFLQPVSGGAM